MTLVVPDRIPKKPVPAVIFIVCLMVFFCYMSGTSFAAGYNHSTGVSIPTEDNPHGGYANTTNKCKTCHAVHLAEGNPSPTPSYVLLRANSASDECDYCHATGGVSQKIISGESHEVHLTATKGPAVECSDCHKVHTTVAGAQFKDNQLLAATTACDICHSPGGAFDGVDDTNYGAKNNWNWVSGESQIYDASDGLKGGKEKWCAGCHDAGTSVTEGVSAPDVAGDNSTYGYYIGGHKINCMYCHDSTTDHIDGEHRTYANSTDNYMVGYRLKYSMNIPFGLGEGYEQADFGLCFRCHSYDNIFDSSEPFDTNFRDDNDHKNMHRDHLTDETGINKWDSDWDYSSGSTDSRVSCPACHNVHGSKTPRLIRSGELISTPATTDKVPALDFKWYESDGTTPTTDFSDSLYGEMSPVADGKNIVDNKVCDTCHTGSEDGKYSRTPIGGLVGCGTCHSSAQGASEERRQITSTGGDFEKNSHHIDGSVTDDDCLVCHDTTYHQDGDSGTIPDPKVYLNDPDGGAPIVYEGTPESLENFCLNCHDSDGANGNTTPLSDGKTVPNVKGVAGSLWQDSAHNQRGYSENGDSPITCMGDGSTTGCHGNAHGSDNEKLLSSGSGVAIDTFCYRCHTQGMITNNAISGSGLADDIQQAFSKSAKHDLGSNFTVGSDSFTVQCTSCHNPHVITGKYWDAESGFSPVTRPNFSDPTSNPRAMGTILWGDESGEKMDNYAALGSGTGGFYYNMARGYSLGDTGLPFDQPAVYQPPKSGSGYEFEFGGDVLPDYATFCLDCHSASLSGGHGNINWGGDPYKHGLTAGNMPGYVSDEGTPGFWGTSGNPDVLFDMNYVTRGRHNGHFMRWPYDSADRGAGINFVLACTDCHEAHGADVGSMLRTNPNDGTGSTVWNVMCNNCHYYYGGQHAGMSCGPAAECHPHQGQASIHRGAGTGSGGTQLMLTAAGYESDFVKPDFTPQIDTVEGHIGSNELIVTFTAGVWANVDLSGNLGAGDFWLFDIGGNNPRTITSVTHTSGEASATLTMSAPPAAADLSTDTLALKPASAWNWYEGGYENWATGIVPAQAVSAGPWPVQMTGPPPVEITSVEGIVGMALIEVTFSEGVYTDIGGSGALQQTDFVLIDNDNGRTIESVEHTAGEATAILTLSSVLDDADDINIDTLAAASSSAIYCIYDNPVGTDPVTITGAICPIGETSFQLNEPAGSTTVTDEQSVLVGAVSDPTDTLTGNEFYGDGVDNYIQYTDADTCLRATRKLTIETRIKPTGIGTANYIKRVFNRQAGGGNYHMTVWRNTGGAWAGYYNAPDNTASIALWIRVVDTHGGNTYKPALADYDAFPIVSDHWYRVKAVLDSDKTGEIPIDIYVDDQGTNGDDADEAWSGFINCTDSDQSQFHANAKLYEGDEILPGDGDFYIGTETTTSTSKMFMGQIDYINVQMAADYTGVTLLFGGLASATPTSAQSLYFASTTPSNYTPSRKPLPNYLAAGQPIPPYLVNAPLNLNNEDVSKNVVLLTLAVGLMLGGFMLIRKAKA